VCGTRDAPILGMRPLHRRWVPACTAAETIGVRRADALLGAVTGVVVRDLRPRPQ
jgi:hypothetical protein